MSIGTRGPKGNRSTEFRRQITQDDYDAMDGLRHDWAVGNTNERWSNKKLAAKFGYTVSQVSKAFGRGGPGNEMTARAANQEME